MKAIIEKGKADNNIQSCFISECGIEIIFHNNDLADKFAKSLDPFHISYVKNGNKIILFALDTEDTSVSCISVTIKNLMAFGQSYEKRL